MPQPITQPKLLGAFIAGVKSAATTRINRLKNTKGQPLWQRNYYEHVIRDDGDLHRIRDYIMNNPRHWDLDREHINYDRGNTGGRAIRESPLRENHR